MKKKILFTWQALIKGGAEVALVNLINRLQYGEYSISILCLKNIIDATISDSIPKAVDLKFIASVKKDGSISLVDRIKIILSLYKSMSKK